MGASAAAAASIIAVSKIFDGVSDLIMGYIVDHTNSRYGKARPWIARLCVPLAVCTVLMFSVPASLGTSAISFPRQEQ
ncbi:MAG: MFS transporter [Dorea sp.]|nr:MFS transporter [Dorea sp.]